MLASPLDAQGLGSLGGVCAARCRRPTRRGLGPLLLWIVERAAGLDRPGGSRRGGGRWCLGVPRPAASRSRAGGGGCAPAPDRVRHLERDLRPLVDRAGSLLGLPQPRARLPRPGPGRDGGGLVPPARGVRLGLRPGGGAGASARLGAARQGVSRNRVRVGEDRPAERARRLLERARVALRDGAAARALAVGTARARALAAGTRSRLRLRAGRRADADLLARRCARRRGRRRPLDRARAAARRERGGGAAGRRGRARRRGLGVLPARPGG